MMLDVTAPTPRRFPFDRVGVLALVCAATFALLATGLSMLLG